MRKIVFIILSVFALFSFGCGSGGSSSNPVTDGSETQNKEEYGSVVFRIELEKPDSLAKRLYRIPANTTGILVRAWDDAGHDVLTEFPISQDISTFDAEIPLPVGTNYRLDAIAYNKPSSSKSILTVARSDPFEIKANIISTLSLTLNSYIVDYTGTTMEVTGGEPLTIQVKITGIDFFDTSAYLYAALETWAQDGYSPYPGVISGKSASSTSKATNTDGRVTYTLLFNINAPVVSTTQPLYYQISFWANNKYRTDNIPFLFLPSLGAGESLGQIIVNPPTGGVIVTMQ